MRIHNITIPDHNSPCAAWKLFYEELVKNYGKANARDAWLYAWHIDGNTSCTKDTEFNKWTKRYDIEVADGTDKALSGVSKIGLNIINGIGATTSFTPKIAIALVIGAIGLALYFGYRIVSKLEPKDILENLHVAKAGQAAKLLSK